MNMLYMNINRKKIRGGGGGGGVEGVLVICCSPMAYTLSLYVYIHEAFIILSCYLNCGLT